MAYNVFKRPMFKRGGSTTGTGIMSHVEPRVNAAIGFPNFGVTQMSPQSQLDAFKQAEIARQNRLSKDFNILGPAFTMPENFPGTVNDYRDMVREQEELLKAGGVKGYGGTSSLDEMARINIEEKAKAQAEKNALLNNEPNGDKDKPAYKGTDIKSEIAGEVEFLKELLKDEKYSKGEMALVIGKALGTPGGLSEKIKVAGEEGMKLARSRREEDKAIKLAAYKLAKEKEKYEARYGQEPDAITYLKEQSKTLAGTPGYEDMTADQVYQELLKEQSSTAKGRTNILTSGATTIYDLRDKIIRKQTELEKATNERTKTALEEELARAKSNLKFFTNMPEFTRFYGKDFLKGALNFKKGGRVMKAQGGDLMDEEDDMQESNVSMTDPIGEGSGSKTVTEPVQKLSYQELRDRLPQEITDDVVNLLANSEEALQEFAYIRTQDDVNSFNTKYGVNLVIPATRG